jgi:hypothetical protein
MTKECVPSGMGSTRTFPACPALRPLRRAWRPICLLLFALPVVGCDPGWHYHATSGTAIQIDGLRFDVPSANPKVRVYASAFTSSLDVELTITNIETQPLTLALPELHASDGRGTPLREKFPTRRSCPLADDIMVIPGGGACTLASVFAIQPLVPGFLLPRDNPDLASISLNLTTAKPATFHDIKVAMTWMK